MGFFVGVLVTKLPIKPKHCQRTRFLSFPVRDRSSRLCWWILLLCLYPRSKHHWCWGRQNLSFRICKNREAKRFLLCCWLNGHFRLWSTTPQRLWVTFCFVFFKLCWISFATKESWKRKNIPPPFGCVIEILPRLPRKNAQARKEYKKKKLVVFGYFGVLKKDEWKRLLEWVPLPKYFSSKEALWNRKQLFTVSETVQKDDSASSRGRRYVR